jgi:acetyl esterase/lipase
MSVDRRTQAPKTGNPGRDRRLVRSGLALAAALLMAAWLPQAANTAGASPRLVSTPPAATTTTTSPLRAPHRQWLNLAYATVSSAEKLDLYMPFQRPVGAKAPGLVVYVHGGAWLQGQGDKANYVSLTFVNFFLSLGYAAASVDYRLSDEAHFPAQIEDVKTAVRWLRAHAAQYGYDPNEIAAMGDSAGGQLVALLGASEGAPALEGSFLGNPRVPSSIKAAIVLYPDIDLLAEEAWLSENPACAGKFSNPNLPGSPASKYLGAPVQAVPARALAADPVTYLAPGKQLPKFLIAHGKDDCTVPYQGSVEFYNALVKMAGPSAAQLIIEPGEGHFPSFDYTELEAPATKLLRATIGPGW